MPLHDGVGIEVSVISYKYKYYGPAQKTFYSLKYFQEFKIFSVLFLDKSAPPSSGWSASSDSF